MNLLKLVFTLLLSSILLMACASNPKPLDEKYIFAELEQVDHIKSYRIDGWSDIDKQSLFVSDSPGKSYLVILKRPSNDIRHANGINFSSKSSTIHAKFDYIKFFNNLTEVDPIPAYIERIYKLENRDQKKMVRAKIKGEPYESTESQENEAQDP
jgi:hypothetical protein